MLKRFAMLSTAAVCLFASHLTLYASPSSNIQGTVKDSQTGEPLPSANIVLVGTSLGAASDALGRYVIRNVPPGAYVVRASYIGYLSKEMPVTVMDEPTVNTDFALAPVTLEGEEVVVTAQARGQHEAINTQLASNNIVSVVSSARIQELPDANAAEAVGRLPGISILRSGGEGNQVVVRGLQPKYNAITLDGVRMSSSNPSDRSTDLSMISPYMLEGIEVSKTVTPDLDADVLGGTVNFKLREASMGKEGLGLNLLVQGGKTFLENAKNDFNNYKYVAGIEGRFLEQTLGVFVQADLERRNLTSNESGGSFTHLGSSTTDYISTSLNLSDIPRDRKRTNGVLVVDYVLPEGKVSLSNFISSGITTLNNRGESFDIQNDVHYYTLAYGQSTLNTLANTLNLEYQLGAIHAKMLVAHTYAETKNPADWRIGFSQASAGLSQFFNVPNLNPKDIPNGAYDDSSLTYLNSIQTSSGYSDERALTAALDLESSLNLLENVSATIKIGGKYKHQTRSREYDQSGGQGLGLQSALFFDNLISSHFPTTQQYYNSTYIPIIPFVDTEYDYGEFLNGDYSLGYPLNYAMLSEVVKVAKENAYILAQRNDIAYFHDQFNSKTFDYSGSEDLSAAYVMATINVGTDLTLIPGVRYQNLRTSYTASRGLQNTASATGGPYFHYDTTVTVNHGYWFPDLIVRYKPLAWFDVRMSYTSTIAYPDYNAVIPRIDVATGGSISWNDSQLRPSTSQNFDVYVSFYANEIGLFTVGGFLKRIDHLIYPWTFFVSGAAALPYFPPGLATGPPSGVYSVTTYVNDPFRVENWGMELDWQTHFWYLPKPFDGLVLNVNYTHIFSEAEYPYTDTRRVGRQLIYVDTSFTDRLLYQPDNIVNLSVGYDYGGFSIRVSMQYQADIFTGPNFWPQLRTSTAAYRRWDLSVKQQLPWLGLQIYADVNNINGAMDVSLIRGSGFPVSMQSYGPTADLGLRWQL